MSQGRQQSNAIRLAAFIAGLALVVVTACRTRDLAPLGEHSGNGATIMNPTSNPPPAGSAAVAPATTTNPELPDGFTFSGSPEAGYVTDFGSSLRSSRVLGKPRSYQHLRRIPIGPLPKSTLVPSEAKLVPRMVLVTPDAQHIVVDWGESFEIRTGDAKPASLGYKGHGGLLYLRNERPYMMGNLYTWSGEPEQFGKPIHGKSPDRGLLSSVRISADMRAFFCQGEGSREEPTNLWTSVFVERFLEPDQSYGSVLYILGYPSYRFALGIDWPRSSSAIDAAFWGVVALRHGQLHVLSNQGLSPQNGPTVDHAISVGYHVADISIVPPGMVLVEEAAPEPARFDLDLAAQEVPSTTVHYLTPQGTEQWKATVGFGLGQPPIDCGDGRICLAGFGLASVVNGKVEWSMKAPRLPSQKSWPTGYLPPAPVRATAFEDGTLAVANHRALQILAKDGSIKQGFTVAEDELITTPPAISPDGRVWVATQQALYCLE